MLKGGGQLDTRLFVAGVGCVCPWTSRMRDILMTVAGECCGDDLCITSSWVLFMLSWCWAAAPWNLSHYFVFVYVLIASWSLIYTLNPFYLEVILIHFILMKIFSLYLPTCPPVCVAILLVGTYLHVLWPQAVSKKRIQHPHQWQKDSRIIFQPCKWESLGTDLVTAVLYPNYCLTNGS